MTSTLLLPLGQWFVRTAVPSGAWKPPRTTPSAPKKLCIGMKKSGSGGPPPELVQPGETIILDSGTTTAEVARHLKRLKVQSLTVITNALNIAVELADAPGISLIMIGGLLRPLACSFVGPQAEAMMNEFHADRLFLAVDGFDLENGPSTRICSKRS